MKKKLLILCLVAGLIVVGAVIVTGMDEQIGLATPKKCFDGELMQRNSDMNNPMMDKPPKDNDSEYVGILEFVDEQFFIGESEVFFGPSEFISVKAADFDYDLDDCIETVEAELFGLTGSEVIALGHISPEGDVVIVEINSLPIGMPPKNHPPHLGENFNQNS